MKKHLSLAFVAVLALFMATAACDLNLNQNTINEPDPVASPSPAPSPSPSPSASPSPAAASDVASMIVLVYGYTCSGGVSPNHAAGIIPAECSAAQLTATPKKADGSDAVNHGNNITWTVSPAPDGNFPGQVVPQVNNPLFNREVNAKDASGKRVPGSVIVTANLIDPAGKAFTASKVVTVQ